MKSVYLALVILDLYKHVNARLSHKNGISALKSSSGRLIISDAEKAELLNNFFVGVGVIDNGLLPKMASPANQNKLSTIVFDESIIGKAIDDLKCKTSSGSLSYSKSLSGVL